MKIDRYIAPPGTSVMPLFALGFRPFFLLAGIMAALWLPLWLVVYAGGLSLPQRYAPATWHAHEMIFGFAVAVIAGFLLTAVKNWTRQRLPTGWPLAGLCLLWLLGRVVMLVAGALPMWLVTVVDVAFLPALAFAIGVPIWRAKSKRNAAFPLIVLGLGALNLSYHLDGGATATVINYVAVDLVVALIVLMGGRVIPMFTRNALPEARVTTYPWLNWAAMLTTLAVVVMQLLSLPEVTAVIALLAGVANLARVALWDTRATLKSPIVWILHVAYLWIGVGLLMKGIGFWVPALALVALHALTVGAITTMILGMITRVALGHTGRPLVVSKAVVVSYWCITLSALVRVIGPLVVPTAGYRGVLDAAGTLWTVAFAIFVVAYWRILTQPRADGAPG